MQQVDSFVAFMAFLKGTVGNNLLNFWLDCEYFKDTMEEYDETQINATRNRLFRLVYSPLLLQMYNLKVYSGLILQKETFLLIMLLYEYLTK